MKKVGIAITVAAMSVFATAAVSAKDNGGGSGPSLSESECEELWESYHTLGNALNDIAGCSGMKCTLTKWKIRGLMLKIKDAWDAGGCDAYFQRPDFDIPPDDGEPVYDRVSDGSPTSTLSFDRAEIDLLVDEASSTLLESP